MTKDQNLIEDRTRKAIRAFEQFIVLSHNRNPSADILSEDKTMTHQELCVLVTEYVTEQYQDEFEFGTAAATVLADFIRYWMNK